MLQSMGHKESDMTEQLKRTEIMEIKFFFYFHTVIFLYSYIYVNFCYIFVSIDISVYISMIIFIIIWLTRHVLLLARSFYIC